MEKNKNYNKCLVIHDGISNEKNALKEANKDINTAYSTLLSNCAQFVQDVLKSVNLKDGKPGISSILTGLYLEELAVPNLIFQNIFTQNYNKNNRYITHKKK